MKTNQKMPVGKRDIITWLSVIFLKKTWIEENADSFKSLCLSVAFDNIKVYSDPAVHLINIK